MTTVQPLQFPELAPEISDMSLWVVLDFSSKIQQFLIGKNSGKYVFSCQSPILWEVDFDSDSGTSVVKFVEKSNDLVFKLS